MAELTTTAAAGVRPLFPELAMYSPSPLRPHAPPLPPFHRQYFTVPRVRRGPMFSAYSELREARLRKKTKERPLATAKKTPEKKQAAAAATKPRSALVALSVPDFSATLRKENRNPGWGSPAPAPKGTKAAAATGTSRGSAPRAGSASANRGEDKQCGAGLLTIRKSYSCLKELKGLSGAASSAIEEEGRATVGGRGRIVKRLSQRY